MKNASRDWSDGIRRTTSLLFLALLLATGHRAFAAKCGDTPGDAEALSAVRVLIEMQCECDTAATHADYVRCARDVVSATINGGGLSRSCGARAMSCARKSTCGRPDAVTCCRTSASGATRCSIARDFEHCTDPPGGTSCTGVYSSCCDACNATGCVPTPQPTYPTPQPTKTPAPLPGEPAFCASLINLPRLARVPFRTTTGAFTCGGATLSPTPNPPWSGAVNDADGKTIARLATGCLYTGALPPAKIPDGATSILDVVGVNGLALTLAGSAGNGPSDCTRGAGPLRHCSNGRPGTDGHGFCDSDKDCGNMAGSCNLDANCFFGPPVPVPNGVVSACVVSAFLTDMCGAADLLTNETRVAAILSSRLFVTGNDAEPCPRCVAGKCSGGKNVDKPCVGIGRMGTSVDCPPEEKKFLGTLTVVLGTLSTGPNGITADETGLFCPDQTVPGAFGVDKVRTVLEFGSPPGGSGNVQAQTLAGVFCVPASGNLIVDGIGQLPGVGALSAPGVLDLSGALPLLASSP